MKKNKLVKLMVIPMVLVGMILPFTQQVSAEHVEVDKDNPAINEKNSLMIEKAPEKKGFTHETNVGDRSLLIDLPADAPVGITGTLESVKNNKPDSFEAGYGVKGILIKDVQPEDVYELTYNYVGKYDKKPISAKVAISNIKQEHTDGLDFDEASLSFSESLFSGFVYRNIAQMDVKISFFDEEGKIIDFTDNGFISINSHNEGEYSAYMNTELTDIYTIKDTTVFYKENDRYPDSPKIWEGSSNEFTDWLGGETFKKATVSYKIKSPDLEFIIGSTHNSAWNAFSSATLFNVLPEKPVKVIQNENGEDIDSGKVKPGQEITYKISQKVNTLGVDLLEKYKSMTFVDKLPEEVTYVDSELQDESGTKVDETGTKKIDESTNTLTYSVSADYLENGMKYNAETYTLNVKVKVKEDVKDGVLLKNIANVTINENSQDTNEVTVIPEIDPPVTPVDPPVTPEPKPDPVVDPVTPQDLKPVTLPATGGMEMSKGPLFAFLVGIGTVCGGVVYFLKKRG